MGSTDAYKDAESNEKPQHKVNLDAYWIDQTPVTNAMFACFLNEPGKQPEENASGISRILAGFMPDGQVWRVTNVLTASCGEGHLVRRARLCRLGWGGVAKRSPVGENRARHGWAHLPRGNQAPDKTLANLWDYVGKTTPWQLPIRRQPVRRAGYGGQRMGMDTQPVGQRSW